MKMDRNNIAIKTREKNFRKRVPLNEKLTEIIGNLNSHFRYSRVAFFYFLCQRTNFSDIFIQLPVLSESLRRIVLKKKNLPKENLQDAL